MRPVLIVGEDNPYGADPRAALFDRPLGSAGDRLRRLVFQVPRGLYVRRFRRVNLCPGRWSTPAARARAAEIVAEIRAPIAPDACLPAWEEHGRGWTLVLLGRKVARAFGLDDAPPFTSSTIEGVGVAILLPHPSGRCREWNDPAAFERAREVLRKAAPDVPWGWAPEGG